MSELSKSNAKKLAEHLFLHADMNGKEIALDLGITEKTICKWREAGKWDEMRGAKTVTKDKLLRNLYEQANLITETAKNEKRTLNSKEVDCLVKIATSIEKLDKKVNLQVAIQVFKDFNNYLKKTDLETAKKVILIQKNYLQDLLPNE